MMVDGRKGEEKRNFPRKPSSKVEGAASVMAVTTCKDASQLIIMKMLLATRQLP
jgi:hypothetical protein